MKKKILILGLVLAAVVVVVVASSKRGGGAKKGIPVTLGTVKTGPMAGKVSGPGKVNPEALVDISAHLPARSRTWRCVRATR
jgi:multidrug efflux pump subunit AcrA (membrane-fusion protein)